MKGRHRGIEDDEPMFKFNSYETYDEPKKSGRARNITRFNEHKSSIARKNPPGESLPRKIFETTKDVFAVCGLVVTAPIWVPIVGAKIIVEDVLGMK